MRRARKTISPSVPAQSFPAGLVPSGRTKRDARSRFNITKRRSVTLSQDSDDTAQFHSSAPHCGHSGKSKGEQHFFTSGAATPSGAVFAKYPDVHEMRIFCSR
jgi:hypothetical protein